MSDLVVLAAVGGLKVTLAVAAAVILAAVVGLIFQPMTPMFAMAPTTVPAVGRTTVDPMPVERMVPMKAMVTL